MCAGLINCYALPRALQTCSGLIGLMIASSLVEHRHFSGIRQPNELYGDERQANCNPEKVNTGLQDFFHEIYSNHKKSVEDIKN
ncbi:hypothetical protein TNCV_84081 [Trichonephila clavipes]|nr:hypothetical protein TNCV_84081 [Trichonephila clavipes]